MKTLPMRRVEGFCLNYFNGFSLQHEEVLFAPYIPNQKGVVAGFSYGAQQALEYALCATHRIDRLILLSPAYFQEAKPAFKRAQLRYFESDNAAYTTQFLRNVAYPSSFNLTDFLHPGTKEQLEALLHYEWDLNKLLRLQQQGVTIEVFLGEQDKIIDALAAFTFFSSVATTYLMKDRGHLLYV